MECDGEYFKGGCRLHPVNSVPHVEVARASSPFIGQVNNSPSKYSPSNYNLLPVQLELEGVSRESLEGPKEKSCHVMNSQQVTSPGNFASDIAAFLISHWYKNRSSAKQGRCRLFLTFRSVSTASATAGPVLEHIPRSPHQKHRQKLNCNLDYGNVGRSNRVERLRKNGCPDKTAQDKEEYT